MVVIFNIGWPLLLYFKESIVGYDDLFNHLHVSFTWTTRHDNNHHESISWEEKSQMLASDMNKITELLFPWIGSLSFVF